MEQMESLHDEMVNSRRTDPNKEHCQHIKWVKNIFF